VRNQVSSGPDLGIPRRFQIPYKPFLKAPWNEFYPYRAYLKDVFINIAGFVPFGFFFCMYLSAAAGKVSRKTVVATIILGAAFSTTIEVLQWFIPVRDSGTTDILTNTLGTTIGATLCRAAVPSTLLGRWRSRPAS
jgi:glycopeptide antibiotics resistance protein